MLSAFERPSRPRACRRASCHRLPRRPSPSGEVNVYTTREPGLIQPLLDAFTKETGIKVNTIFVESGLAERVEAEGANSPADIISVVDYGNLIDLRRPRPHAAGRVAPRSTRRCPRTCAIRTELVRALDARPRHLRLEGPRDRAAHDLRGSRRSEVEGPRLHPLRPASLQHLALRRDDRQGRRREGRSSS